MTWVQNGSVGSVLGGSSITASITGATAGNLLVCELAWSASVQGPVATPTGWTIGISSTGNGNSTNGFSGTAVFFKQASAGSNSAVMSMPNSTSSGEAIISEFSGYTFPVSVNVTALNGGGNNINSLSIGPSATTTVAATLVLYIFCQDENDAGTTTLGISTPGAGTTNALLNNDNTGNVGCRGDWKERSTTGTESATWTWTPANQGVGFADGSIVILAGSASTTPAQAPLLTKGIGSTTGFGAFLAKLRLGQIQPAFIPPAVVVAAPQQAPLFTKLGSSTGIGGLLATLRLNRIQPTIIGPGDISLGLTGVTGTGSVGTLGVNVAPIVTGVTGTGSVNSPTVGVSTALSGVTGTGSVNSPTVNIATGALPSVTGTGSVGSLTPSITAALVGLAGTGSVGTLGPLITTGLAGVAATGSVSSPGVNISVVLPSVQGVTSIGTITSSGGTPIGGTYHSVSFFNSVAGYTSVSFYNSISQFNSEVQP